MRADVCSSIQGTKSKDEKDRGGHCKKWRWTPQNACLGIVAVDTAKTLKMEWEGWEGWESRVWVVAVDTAKRMKMHAINNNQVFITTSLQSFRLKSASYNNQVVIPTCMPSKLQTQRFLAVSTAFKASVLAHFFFCFFGPVIVSPDACKEWNWNTFGG